LALAVNSYLNGQSCPSNPSKWI